MQAQVGLGLRGSAWTMHLARTPFLGVLAEERATAGWVDVDAVRQVATDAVEELLRVDLRSK